MDTMGKDTPKAPSARDMASAQTAQNVSTAVANNYLGNTNQITPYGNLTYDQTGTYVWKDPETGDKYNLPQFTATQTLSPAQQQLYNTNTATQQNLADIGKQQSGFLEGYLGQPFQFDRSTLNAPRLDRTISYAGNITNGFGDAGKITRTYGANDYSEDRQRVEDALMARMNPYLEQDRENLRTQMVNQGLNIGTEAYTRGMDDFGRQVNDARYGAILSAGQEQSRLNDMEAQRAGFQNAAQAQQYGQLQGRAAFNNTAQQQQFGQNAAESQFYNQVQQLLLGNQVQLQGINDQRDLAQRNQPLNEIAALLSGSQVQQPNFITAGGTSMPTTDIAGLMQQQYSNQLGAYNTQQANIGAALGTGARLIGGF